MKVALEPSMNVYEYERFIKTQVKEIFERKSVKANSRQQEAVDILRRNGAVEVQVH